MKIDFYNAVAIAQLTSVLIIIAFLLAFYVSQKTGKSSKSRR